MPLPRQYAQMYDKNSQDLDPNTYVKYYDSSDCTSM